jgi:mono/diheme cytochrome c family protein
MVQRVLAVAVFVGFWVVIALGLLMLASRGGPSGAAKPRRLGRGSNGAVGVMFVVTVVVFGVALPVLILTGNHSNASAQVGGVKLTTAQKTGRILFGEHCGVCHTLSAANAVGKVGPNLDILKPAESIILHTLQNGCLPNASTSSGEGCLGQGVMPANVVTGRDAQDVASFVAKVAGNE